MESKIKVELVEIAGITVDTCQLSFLILKQVCFLWEEKVKEKIKKNEQETEKHKLIGK